MRRRGNGGENKEAPFQGRLITSIYELFWHCHSLILMQNMDIIYTAGVHPDFK